MSSSSDNTTNLLDSGTTFQALCRSVGMDVRLSKALARLGYVRPTLVQSKSIPLALTSGRDLLVRARTGSGKTLAYCLPVLQKVLAKKRLMEERGGGGGADGHDDDDDDEDGGGGGATVRGVILVPTRELCAQVAKVIDSLTYYCDDQIKTVVLSGTSTKTNSSSKKGKGNEQHERLQQEALLRDRPDVAVATPAGLVSHVRSGSLNLKKSVETLVVDEADLILSFGYADDVTEIMRSLPKTCQGFLMSATLSPELNKLKGVVLHSPAVLRLEEDEETRAAAAGGNGGGAGQLTQFYLDVPRKDKNLVLYVFLKMGLLKGKGLFFVNTVDGGYRLKLFLEQFHIKSAVLNAELPLRSRWNILEQFNVGNFDYLIATDEGTDRNERGDEEEEEEEESDDDDAGDEDGAKDKESIEKKKIKRKKKKKAAKNAKKNKRRRRDENYGASRGLDFRGVSFVVNVDLPSTPESYTHRIGRTARGGASGVALSLVDTSRKEETEMLVEIQEGQPTKSLGGAAAVAAASAGGNGDLQATNQGGDDEGGGGAILHPQEQRQPCPLDFDLNEIEGFRYRVEDVSRAVTRVAVRETRANEVKAEILNSERLQSHFQENPSDLQLLQHDRQATHVSKVQDHLKHVPKYMLPRGMQVADMKKRRKKRRPRNTYREVAGGAGHQGRRKDNDPLQNFQGDVGGLEEVAGEDGDEGASDGKFFDGVDGEGGDDGDDVDATSEEKNRVFLDQNDGTGKSTAGRNVWMKKHQKGKFSKKFEKKTS